MTLDAIATKLGIGHSAVQEMIGSLVIGKFVPVGYRVYWLKAIKFDLGKNWKRGVRTSPSPSVQSWSGTHRLPSVWCCEESEVKSTLWEGRVTPDSSASLSSGSCNCVLPQGNIETSRTVGKVCTGKRELCRKIHRCLRMKVMNFVITSLTPWSRVLLEQLTSKHFRLSRNSRHLWNPKVPHRTHK